jgi:hypothetical protein
MLESPAVMKNDDTNEGEKKETPQNPPLEQTPPRNTPPTDSAKGTNKENPRPLEKPTNEKPPANPPGKPAPPPASKTVMTGKKSERELKLERDLVKREKRISELEDENQRLKNPPAPAEVQKKHWLEDII